MRISFLLFFRAAHRTTPRRELRCRFLFVLFSVVFFDLCHDMKEKALLHRIICLLSTHQWLNYNVLS